MEGPSPLWMLLLTIGATLLGGWMWFERGFILSLKVKGDSIEIFHLLGLEVLPFSLAQALCPIRILGQNDYALVTKNGAVVPLNLGGFLASKNLLDILKMRIQEHNNQTNTKIELPE